MTLDLDLNSLLNYLKENELSPELQKETNQVFIVMKIKEQEVPVFFVIRKESELLQTVAYLPYQIPEKTFGEVARMLHLLNRELDMPGFGMDEAEKLLFYRCVIPCPGNQLDERLLTMYLGTTRIAVDTFMHAIGVIVSGSATVDEVLNSKNSQQNQNDGTH